MSGATWRGRTLGAALALLVQALFLSMMVLSPSRPARPLVNLAHETILLLRSPARPTPGTIDTRGVPHVIRRPLPTLVPVLPPSSVPSLAPPSGLTGFGQALFGCAPEHYADLTPDQRAHCPKPGEGLAKNDDQDLAATPRSHAKYEARWQEQWTEDHWMPAPCLPIGGTVVQCLTDQSKAENERSQAAWDKIAADEAASLKTKPLTVPPLMRQGQNLAVRQSP